jgi:hypothetical protein
MSNRKIVLRRIGISMLIGMVIGVLISEGSYFFLKEANRPPERVEIVIPAGTAERVAQGEAPPTIPEEMTFVLGDTLVVTNEDVTNHELGPLWIPPGTSASLQLDQVEEYAFVCSFQPTKYLGVDVREPLTVWTRLGGILLTGIPLGAMLAVYSLVAWPLKEAEQPS